MENPDPPKKKKDLKTATHILKKVALQRYRAKLHKRLGEFEREGVTASVDGYGANDLAGTSLDDSQPYLDGSRPNPDEIDEENKPGAVEISQDSDNLTLREEMKDFAPVSESAATNRGGDPTVDGGTLKVTSPAPSSVAADDDSSHCSYDSDSTEEMTYDLPTKDDQNLKETALDEDLVSKPTKPSQLLDLVSKPNSSQIPNEIPGKSGSNVDGCYEKPLNVESTGEEIYDSAKMSDADSPVPGNSETNEIGETDGVAGEGKPQQEDGIEDKKTAGDVEENGGIPDENGGKSEENVKKSEENDGKPEENFEKPEENVENVEENDGKPKENEGKSQENGGIPDENVEKPEKNAEQPEENAEKSEENAENPKENTEMPEENVEKVDENAGKVEENAEKLEENVQKSEENAENVKENAGKSEENAEKSEKNAGKTEENVAETTAENDGTAKENVESTEEKDETSVENADKTEKEGGEKPEESSENVEENGGTGQENSEKSEENGDQEIAETGQENSGPKENAEKTEENGGPEENDEKNAEKSEENAEKPEENGEKVEENVEKSEENAENVEENAEKSEEDEKMSEQVENQTEEKSGEKSGEEQGAMAPPIIEQDSEEAKQEEEKIKEDFFYNLEEFQSVSRVSQDSGIPSNILEFYHSFGYDCCKRSNLYLLAGPTALFSAGNLVHLLSLVTGEHTFLRSAGGGSIGALTVHPSGKYFVVAEKGIKPLILVYEYPSLKLYRVLRDGTERAYSFVDFDPKGNLLASVGSYPDYMLTVWDWTNEKIMLRSKAFSQEVFRVTFSPEQEGQLTSCGTTHIRFWKMAWTFTGLKLKGEIGRFGKTELSDIEGYIQLPDGKVLSGCDWGNMLLWDGGLIKVEICRKNDKSCHLGSIQLLVMDEGELITIGLDGYVRVWEMEAIDSADTTDDSDVFEVEPMNELLVGDGVQLTSMVKGNAEEEGTDDGSSIWYAQDSNGGIWKLDLSFSHTTKPPEKLFSFTAGGISGLSCSPVSHLVASTGDSVVRVYDYLTTKVVCQFKAPTPNTRGTSLLWPSKLVDAKGTNILAGYSDGIMRSLTLRQIDGKSEIVLKQAMKPHSGSITAMSFNGSGEVLATGSSDRTVFFFGTDDGDLTPVGFVPVPGEVTSLQWSPPGFMETTLLVGCSNGKVVEISAPTSADTSHSYKLSNVPIKYYTFKSIKSQLRKNEEQEKKEKERAKRRKERERVLKRRKDKGEEISDEEARNFLEEDPEDQEEVGEEEPLFIPPTPSPVLQAIYLTPGRFAVSMGDYDAGYLYECRFPDEQPAVPEEQEGTAAVRTVPVEDSDDVPMTSIHFTQDGHKMAVGFQNGAIRVYPLEGDPEAPFDLDLMQGHWDLNMHDNDTGSVLNITESHDGAYFFSGGGDGNLFGFVSLKHEEIVESMKGQRAKLPTPKRKSPDETIPDDIDDPSAYSIEDAKLKAEHDKMMRDAEAKKMMERKKIGKLRKDFLELLNRNEELPADVQLKREEFELDPSLRKGIVGATEERIKRVRTEMQWEKEKLALAHQKLKHRYKAELDCDRVTVHSFNSSHSVSSYRVAKLAEEFHSLKQAVEQRVRAASLASEGGVGQTDGNGASLGEERGKEEEEDESFLDGAAGGRKRRQTILQGRQAEKVAKALKRAEEAKTKRERRQKEWEELLKSKPDENFEDPADMSAIREAQANMGDFKLKTAPDYVVPEHLRMDTEKKRYQMLVLQGLIYSKKSEFNWQLLRLRDSKAELVASMKKHSAEVKRLQASMPGEERVKVPRVPALLDDEQPHRKLEFTRETLLQFEEDVKSREEEEKKKKREGDGGLFGGFGGDKQENEGDLIQNFLHRKSVSSMASSAVSRKSRQALNLGKAPPTPLEEQLRRINGVRVRYQRDKLVRSINENLMLFDAELRLLRNSKTKLDVELKMADLRQITLVEELLLLKEYEKRETTLSGRVMGKRVELAEMNGKATEMQGKLEVKRRDIERLSDREKALHASFAASLGENNKFSDFLTKVFRKKIKRAKKKAAREEGGDESDESSSDESDWSSDEEDDDSVEGGFDDSQCPPGCDQNLFDSTLTLREKRLDLEELLAEERKLAETLKKDSDATVKKAKVIETQLKTALADLEAFQIEKQGKLNELDVVVPVKLHQIEHVHNAAVPADLSQCLIFGNASLTALQRRIKELQLEKGEQRKFYKEARQQHVHLIKNRRVMESRIEILEEKCEHMMMLKFGRVVNLERLESVTVNRNMEEMKEELRQNEASNSREVGRRQKRIDKLKARIVELTRDNTKRLDRLNVLVNDKDSLEQQLDQRQHTLELGDLGKKKTEAREQHRLVQLVQLQAQEIQALKEEIGLLSRKGGHILPPAQPPLGADQDVM